MDDKIKAAFDTIRADDELKNSTKAFIAKKTHGYTVRKALNYRKIILVSAAACLALVLFAGVGLYFTPTARINIDINPSLELKINRFDKVISVNALNDDAKTLVETLDIKFMGYDEALRKILDNQNIETMLYDNEIMTITVIETNSAQSARILSNAKTCANGYNNVYCHSASSKEASEAHALGLSCGKYQAYLELHAIDPDITPEDIQGMTMREIRERIADLMPDNGNDELPSTTGGHHGNGNGHGCK